jgi:AAA+ superfamily predicted ATPase
MTSKALKAAKGGIFFLDEAYMLSNSESANDFGQEAIDTINKYMEDNRGDMLVIAAGYKDEMVNFMISNPGLKSRFKHELDFKPMDNEQLYAVYEQFCKQYELSLDEEATSLLHKVLHRAHRLGEFHKSNARGVRDMFERMLVKQAQRLAEEGFDLESADLQTIVKQDIYVPETINDGNVTFLSSKKDD